MGFALAQAILSAGHQVVIACGPVALPPPAGCELIPVETTDDLLKACSAIFPQCDGVIATAAVCDYRPKSRFPGKLAKKGVSLELELVETADVLADLGRHKGDRWIIGFALESDEFAHINALRKLKEKNCDAIILNRPTAIGSESNRIEIIDPAGQSVESFEGSKTGVAINLWKWIERHIAH